MIGSYTDLVGKPFLPPVYGLELGDSDCYLHNANRGERHTLDALDIAQGYVDNGMPNGWMLVNDGYGCGYQDLAETGAGFAKTNMAMGLWTQDGLDTIVDETAAGVKVRKLDVAWVGPGYRFALDGCQSAYDGIQSGTDVRGFVYQPNSWAGAQRCGVLWSGDQAGSWDYIRWQIPTYAASTLSGIFTTPAMSTASTAAVPRPAVEIVPAHHDDDGRLVELREAALAVRRGNERHQPQVPAAQGTAAAVLLQLLGGGVAVRRRPGPAAVPGVPERHHRAKRCGEVRVPLG